jgi:hypothetical protein
MYQNTYASYGDITPVSDSFRIFLIFYMLSATVMVAISLNEALDLYLNDIMAERIIKTIIESCTYVHKADIDRTGIITEAE